MANPTDKMIKREHDISLFKEYHHKYPTQGYCWLNTKIALDLGILYSDNCAQKVSQNVCIKSVSKQFRSYKATDRLKILPNLLLADLSITSPFQVIVSDMTAFWYKDTYYELTLYIDLFNNAIVAYDLSSKKGDKTTYINGLNELIQKKNTRNLELILHTNQGSVYSSKAFNEALPI